MGAIEPRFGGAAQILSEIVNQHANLREEIGGLKASTKGLEEGQKRLESGLTRLGDKFDSGLEGISGAVDRKFIAVSDDIDKLHASIRSAQKAQESRYERTEQRIATLEDDKTYVKGVGVATKVALGLVGTVAVAAIGFFSQWLLNLIM